MRPISAFCRLLYFSLVGLAMPLAFAQVNVTTYHNDNYRTGQNTQETVLTPANVNFGTFGRIFADTLDGQVYAQPLVLSNVSIGGGTHNVVYAATQNDSLYAIDANTGYIYWQVSLGSPELSNFLPWGHGPCNDITPQYGITSTPVINPAKGTIYVVARNGLEYRLHALSVSTGAELSGSPVIISGTYDGLTFDGSQQGTRPALLYANGNIVFGAGSHCDEGTWYGWVFSYNASTLVQNGIFSTEPGGHCAGVWMSGNGVAADSSGDLYFSTGNSGQYLKPDYGDAILKMSPAGSGFAPLDYFSPSIGYLTNQDMDVGSGGVLLIPGTSRLVQVGKAGTLYLVNTTTGSMGEYCGSVNCTDKIVQEIFGASVGTWGSPAYWNGYLYFGSAAEGDYANGNQPVIGTMKAYTFNVNGSPELTLVATTPEDYAWPTPTPSVSANGTSNGIVWAIDNSSQPNCCAVLHAYQATNINHELYNSNQIAGRDQAGGGMKFTVPTIANGKVYVGGAGSAGNNGQLTAYGPISPTAILSPKSWTVIANTTSPPSTNNFTLTNATASSITISSVDTVQGNFYVKSDTCGSSLASGASCTIVVEFDPSSYPPGVYPDTLEIIDSAPNSPQTAALKATVRCKIAGC